MAVNNGQIADYKSFYEENRKAFDLIASQNFTDIKMIYTFINNSVVIVTFESSALTMTKDGQQMKIDPFLASLVFTKTKDFWKIIYSNEYGIPVPVENDSIKNE